MTILESYLYNDFGYKIETGRIPILVNDAIVYADKSIPRVIWEIDFGRVTTQLKNAIEEGIFLSYDELYFKSYVGPAYKIGKYIDVLSGDISYYLTYVFEYAYYNGFVNKPLDYVIDGSDHIIADSIRIPIAQAETDAPIVVDKAGLLRKLHFLSSDLKIVHKANDISTLKATFYEQASPLNVSANTFTVGVTNVNYNTTC